MESDTDPAPLAAVIEILSNTHPPPKPPESDRFEATTTETEALLQRLRRNPVFLKYQGAFEVAAGMPLWLEAPADGSKGPPLGGRECPSEHINPFCRKIFWTEHPCQACLDAHSLLSAMPEEKASTVECFAGLQVTAVPIWLGRRLLGYLRTGQVFTKAPTEEVFTAVAATLAEDDSLNTHDLDYVRDLYFTGSSVEGGRYAAMVQLLVFFAEQLAAIVDRHLKGHSEDWPDPVRKVAAFMQRQFAEEHTLDDLARVAGLSANHLCGVFKEAAGMTMTEYLNRERIHQAKKRLLSRYARVSEVCLDVGFGSLSQFNRCFTRYAGESPTAYRQRMGGSKLF